MPANHNKKPSERRDSLKQQQRKHNPTGNKPKDPQSQNNNTSSGSNKSNLHTSHRANTPPAAASASNTASGSSAPSTPPLSHTPQPVTATTTTGSNGFNTYVVTQFLNKRFSDTFAAYHDDSNPETRPKKHESQEKAWGIKGGLPSVWGQKGGLMANGNDMLTELLK